LFTGLTTNFLKDFFFGLWLTLLPLLTRMTLN